MLQDQKPYPDYHEKFKTLVKKVKKEHERDPNSKSSAGWNFPIDLLEEIIATCKAHGDDAVKFSLAI